MDTTRGSLMDGQEAGRFFLGLSVSAVPLVR